MRNFISTIFKRLKPGLFLNFLHLSSIQISNALLQVIFLRTVIYTVGLVSFGQITLSYQYAALAGMFINFGTSQSGIKEIAVNREDPVKISEAVSIIFLVRLLLFSIYVILNITLIIFNAPVAGYLTLAGTLILAEVINPFFLFVGLEKLSIYNILNILSNLGTIILIMVFVSSSAEAPLVNFFVGAANCTIYVILIFSAIRKYNLKLKIPSFQKVLDLYRSNWYLLGNNLSVQLQQSFFIFMLGWSGNSLILGAYAICDKVVWSCRMLLSAVSNAVFSNGAIIYLKEGVKGWRKYKKQLTVITSSIFIIGSLILLIFAELIIEMLTGKLDPTAVMYLRSMAFAPFLASLNVFNVLELLYKGDNRRIFFIAIILLLVSVISTVMLVTYGESTFFGYYLPFMDLIALALYTHTIKKYTNIYAL